MIAIKRFYPFAATRRWVRRQRVQSFKRKILPSIAIFEEWIFADHLRLVRLFEWDTLCPNCTLLPQNSHFMCSVNSFDGYDELL